MDRVQCNNCGANETVLLTKSKNVGTSRQKELSIVVCKECGLAYLNPQPTEEMYTAFYRTYGRKNRGVESLIKEKEDQRGYIGRIAPHVRKDNRILDMGCGKGIFLHFLKEAGYTDVRGIELSEDEIVFAKSTFGVEVDYATIESYAGRKFDFISLIALIEHFKNPRASVAAARDALADDGLLFISTPNVKKMVLRKGIDQYFKFVHTYYFSLTTLTSIIQQAGFEIVFAEETPVRLNKSFLHPRDYTDSDLLVLARKTNTPGSVLKERPETLLQALAEAKRRDLLPSLVSRLDQIKGFGALFRLLRSAFP